MTDPVASRADIIALRMAVDVMKRRYPQPGRWRKSSAEAAIRVMEEEARKIMEEECGS